jgi:hypothetical protein
MPPVHELRECHDGVGMSRLLHLVLPLACACFAASQTIEGTLTNRLTGAGIAGAQVIPEPGDKNPGSSTNYTTATDADGHFRIEGLKDGTYMVSYEANGYDCGLGIGDLRNIEVRAGGRAERIDQRCRPLSRIAGRVADSAGEPVAKAHVELTTDSAFVEVDADSRGNFELPNLDPDVRYKLLAEPPPGTKAPPADPETGEVRGWAQTFYPGVALRKQAVPITLAPGSELLGLEIKLLAVPVHRVRGVLLDPDGNRAPRTPVELWEESPRPGPAYQTTETKDDGTFEFPSVVDGEWRLSAERHAPGYFHGDLWIEIKNRDADDVKLRLNRPFTLHGKVILETPQGAPMPGALKDIRMFQRHDGILVLRMPPLDSRPQKSDDGFFYFDFQNLFPGTYQIVPLRSPPLYYLDSMRLGDTPISDIPDQIELSSAPPMLVLTYKTNGGTVRGTVDHCGTGRVVLTPQDMTRWNYSNGACDSAGHYQITGLRPGEYRAIAIPEGRIWPFTNGRDDPDFLRQATSVTVRAGESTQVDLALVTVR